MSFYDNSKEERKRISEHIESLIFDDYQNGSYENIVMFSADKDTYIRKIVYLATGKLYKNNEALREEILNTLDILFKDENEYIRQTVAYSLGEIGKIDAYKVSQLLEKSLDDVHHSVRNAVIGALKQMGNKNPKPTLEFAAKFYNHEDPEVRRQVIHGIELRGRTHPEEVLPILFDARNETNRRVRDMLIHVLGQISYKSGCLEKVIEAIKDWENKDLINDIVKEILEVHKRYEKFSDKSFNEAKEYIENIIHL
ncbi:HEAT repeat domain-containing protein [Tissierella sp.]|uniref:HEAT repeat domain-containing protein n=1 Tax=Tissierella sp. TaxID=41274 RepID=UPI0028610EB1|nr:HEAT repeat domain-containing protein [Tissierella sp.]MDR7856618.1 HEAT repeat domain-containing protein [Tissierella sp.]